jgi:hypothetical protein
MRDEQPQPSIEKHSDLDANRREVHRPLVRLLMELTRQRLRDRVKNEEEKAKN